MLFEFQISEIKVLLASERRIQCLDSSKNKLDDSLLSNFSVSTITSSRTNARISLPNLSGPSHHGGSWGPTTAANLNGLLRFCSFGELKTWWKFGWCPWHWIERFFFRDSTWLPNGANRIVSEAAVFPWRNIRSVSFFLEHPNRASRHVLASAKLRQLSVEQVRKQTALHISLYIRKDNNIDRWNPFITYVYWWQLLRDTAAVRQIKACLNNVYYVFISCLIVDFPLVLW